MFDPQGPNNCQKRSTSPPASEHPIRFMTQVPMAPLYVRFTKHLFNFKVYMAALLNPRVFVNILFLPATPRRWRKFISCVKCKMTEGLRLKLFAKSNNNDHKIKHCQCLETAVLFEKPTYLPGFECLVAHYEEGVWLINNSGEGNNPPCFYPMWVVA